eukprot:2070580-Pleurochrysis_carterae.AAC.1
MQSWEFWGGCVRLASRACVARPAACASLLHGFDVAAAGEAAQPARGLPRDGAARDQRAALALAPEHCQRPRGTSAVEKQP